MRVYIVGASGKLGRYMVQHALDRGYEVAGVCREQSAGKLDAFKGRITAIRGRRDQVEACRRVFASDTRWTVVRGSDLEGGESQAVPGWSRHVGDAIVESNITRRVDFALFMVEALANDELVHKAPAIAGCQTRSALAHGARTRTFSGPAAARARSNADKPLGRRRAPAFEQPGAERRPRSRARPQVIW